MKRFIVFALLGALLVSGCGQSDTSPAPPAIPAPVQKADALSKMQTVFQGSYTREQIKARMNKAMQIYGVPIDEDHYNRCGSVLVKLNEDSGVPEMDTLSYMIRNHVDHVKMSFADMAALSAAAIKAGDK